MGFFDARFGAYLAVAASERSSKKSRKEGILLPRSVSSRDKVKLRTQGGISNELIHFATARLAISR